MLVWVAQVIALVVAQGAEVGKTDPALSIDVQKLPQLFLVLIGQSNVQFVEALIKLLSPDPLSRLRVKIPKRVRRV